MSSGAGKLTWRAQSTEHGVSVATIRSRDDAIDLREGGHSGAIARTRWSGGSTMILPVLSLKGCHCLTGREKGTTFKHRFTAHERSMNECQGEHADRRSVRGERGGRYERKRKPERTRDGPGQSEETKSKQCRDRSEASRYAESRGPSGKKKRRDRSIRRARR